MDSARRVDTWRHGGGLYLEHIAVAKLTSGHGRKRQACFSSKGCRFWGLRFVTLTQTRRRTAACHGSYEESQESWEVAGLACSRKQRERRRGPRIQGGLLLRGVIALGPGSDASGRRGADGQDKTQKGRRQPAATGDLAETILGWTERVGRKY